MSFEDEWAEVNANYWNCRADVDALTARVVELEQVLSEYMALVQEAPLTDERNIAGWEARRDGLQQRARVLLHEGQSDPAKEEPK